MQLRISTKDIARISGLSTATIDRVLHERPGVRPETVAKVKEAVDLLQKREARASSGAQHHRFGLCMQAGPGFINRFQQELVKFEDRLFDGRSVEMNRYFTNDLDVASFAETLSKAASENEGLIVACQEALPIRETINRISAEGFPIVCVTTDLPTTRHLGCLGMDQYRAGRAAGRLIGRYTEGQEGEVLLVVSGSFRCQQEREIGFREIIRQRFKNLSVAESVQSLDSDEPAYLNTKAFLSNHRSPLAIYNISGGNRGLLRAMEEFYAIDKRPVFICHDLTQFNRENLSAERIDAVIDYDAELVLARAIQTLVNFYEPETFRVPKEPLDVKIWLPDTV